MLYSTLSQVKRGVLPVRVMRPRWPLQGASHDWNLRPRGHLRSRADDSSYLGLNMFMVSIPRPLSPLKGPQHWQGKEETKIKNNTYLLLTARGTDSAKGSQLVPNQSKNSTLPYEITQKKKEKKRKEKKMASLSISMQGPPIEPYLLPLSGSPSVAPNGRESQMSK